MAVAVYRHRLFIFCLSFLCGLGPAKVSHRSGETEDSFIADLVVGLRGGAKACLHCLGWDELSKELPRICAY